MELYEVLKFLHILAVVFMSAPLYNLIIVNERVRFGKAPAQVDRYFENLIRGNAVRCCVFQLTVFMTGVNSGLHRGESLEGAPDELGAVGKAPPASYPYGAPFLGPLWGPTSH